MEEGRNITAKSDKKFLGLAGCGSVLSRRVAGLPSDEGGGNRAADM